MENEENAVVEDVGHQNPAPKPPLAPQTWKANKSRKRKMTTAKKVIAPQEKNTNAENTNSRRTSWVWDHFTEYKVFDEKDPTKVLEIRAACDYCGKTYAAQGKKHGTGNMINHLEEQCLKYPYRLVDEKQKTLSLWTTKDGCVTLKSSSYSEENCWSLLTKMVIVDELPFRIVEGLGFKAFVAGLQPKFSLPSRFTIARDCLKLFNKEKMKLKRLIKSERVCLTKDTWTSIQNINYMCLTGHWIDKSWNLQKRILSFSVIPNHKRKTIGKMIERRLVEWDIDKLLTITVDNATSNDSAIDYLRKKSKGWKTTIFEHEFLHVRCCAHSLNLVVKVGLKEYNESILKIRNAVRYVRSSPARVQAFKKCADIEKIESKSLLCLDIETRWNSTYLMLETALKFEKAFDRLKEDDSNYRKYFSMGDKEDDAKGDGSKIVENDEENESIERKKSKDKYVGPSDDEDWMVARCFVKFLKIFYKVTLQFSGSLTVNSNLFFHKIVSVQIVLRNLSKHGDPKLALMAIKMEEKFTKYWKSLDKMNFLLYIATALDPRYKMKFVRYCFDQIYQNDFLLSRHMEEQVKNVLTRLYKYYEQFNPCESNETQTLSSSKAPMDIDLDETIETCGSLAAQFAKELENELCDRNKSELTRYLEENCERSTDSFDILKWWKDNSSKFPVLSQLAREILAILVSTVSSESAFTISGRILDPFRSSLSTEMVEALVCCQNWLRADPLTIDINESMKEVPFKDAEKYEEIVNEICDGGTFAKGKSVVVDE